MRALYSNKYEPEDNFYGIPFSSFSFSFPLFLFLLIVQIALSFEMATAQSPATDWRSVRHSGMGSATTALAVDSESVFANPAGLARMRNPRSRDGLHEIHFPRLGLASGEPQLPAISDNLFSSPKDLLPQIMKSASGNENKATHFEATLFPSIVFGGKSAATWLIGFYARSLTDFIHQNGEESSVFDLQRDTTVGAVIGIAGAARAGTFSYGLTIRPNARYYSFLEDANLSTSEHGDLFSNSLQLDRTVGFGLDGGLLFTAADFWLPTIGLAVRNLPSGCASHAHSLFTEEALPICGTKRTGTSDPSQNRTIVDPMDLRLGVSMTPRFRLGAERLNLRLAADASPIGVRTEDASYGMPDVPLTELLKFGGELFFGHPLRTAGFAARAGVQSGELTWGATIQFWTIQFDYASYIRETRFNDGEEIPERQHYLGISTVW